MSDTDEEVYVCQVCGHEDDPDRFGRYCPACGTDLDELEAELEKCKDAGGKALRAAASEWRAARPQYSGGVVLIWQGEVYGWKSSLRAAGHERPGSYAVDGAGHVFVTEGGDDRNGAKHWVALGPED